MNCIFIQSLSKLQKFWGVIGVVIIVLLVFIGLLVGNFKSPIETNSINLDMTLKEAAPKLGVTGSALAKELGLPLDAPKNVPMSEMGVKKGNLETTKKHLISHKESPLKYYLYGAFVLWGWLFLVVIGRPRKIDLKKRKLWYPHVAYIIPLVISVIVLGFFLGKSPNPMEGSVKLFKTMVGLYPDVLVKVLVFFFFIALAVIGNKLVCGWACPFGALQEIIYSLPFFKKIKGKKLPFAITNSIRGGLFVVTLLLLFGVVGNNRGFVLYHQMNPFNLFDLEFETILILVTVVVSLILGLLVYRPFCQLICPFGFLSWFAERISLFRVKVNHTTCTECGNCIRACPLGAAQGIVEKKKFPADCFSCVRCLNVCPVDAISYNFVFFKENEQRPHKKDDRKTENKKQENNIREV